MIKLLVTGLFLAHGFVTGAQSFGTGKGVANPAWLRWWPSPLGQSWLLHRFGLDTRLIMLICSLLWLAAGVAFAGAGLSRAGVLVPPDAWRMLAGASAALSLVLLALFLHPYYLIGILLNVGILMAALRTA